MNIPTPARSGAVGYSDTPPGPYHGYFSQDGVLIGFVSANGGGLLGADANLAFSTTDFSEFSAFNDPSSSTFVLEGAKVPITLELERDDAVLVTFDFGPTSTSQTITPAAGKEYIAARLVRRF